MTGLCLSVVLALYLVQWTFQVEGCQVEVEKVGCFADKTRPLQQLLLYRRDTLADEELSVSLPRLLCDCAVLAESKGYTYIGLQYYAECWSNSEPLPDYDRDGPSEECYNKVYEKCGDEDTECVGDSSTNYVYKIKAKSVPESQTNSALATLPSTSATTLLSTSATTLLSTLPNTSPTLPSTSALTTTLPSTSATPIMGVTTKPSSTTAPPQPPCQDKNPECPNINSGFCNSNYPAMLEQCPKTCGVCK